MSRFHEEIRQALLEVEKFLLTTLNGVNLPSSAKKQKESILSKIDSIRENYSSLLPPKETNEDDVSGGSVNTGSGGSAPTEDADEQTYSDSISPIGAQDIHGATKSSNLMKRRKPGSKALLISAYQRRWCVLKGTIFYYFDKHTDKKQAGAFCVAGYEFSAAPFLLEKEPVKKDLSFELIRPGHRVYQFLANSKEDYTEWKEAITKASVLVERPSPQISPRAPAPAPVPVPDDDPEEIYDPIEENVTRPESIRPMSEEIYEVIPGNEGPMEDYDDCMTVKKPPVTSQPPPLPPTLPANLPPKVPSESAPQVPTRGPPKDVKDGPALPPRNAATSALPPPSSIDDSAAGGLAAGADDVVYPDFSSWKLGDDKDYGNMYYGKWDCEVENDNELGFKRGDILHVLSREYEAKEWWVAELCGKVGLVPMVYLTEAYTLMD